MVYYLDFNERMVGYHLPPLIGEKGVLCTQLTKKQQFPQNFTISNQLVLSVERVAFLYLKIFYVCVKYFY